MHNGFIGYQFFIPREAEGGAFDHAAFEKDRAMKVAGETVLREIGEGNRATVMYQWQREFDYSVMATRHQLTVDLCPVDRRQIVLYDSPVYPLVPWRPQPSVVSRIRRFFANKWREAGETVRQCKA